MYPNGVLLMALVYAALSGCSTTQVAPQDQMAFTTPQNAAKVLAMAARSGDVDDLLLVLGPEAREILSSGDPVADRAQRQVFLVAFEQAWSLHQIDKTQQELVVGHEAWPFPIPLVKGPAGWRFDSAAGKVEVLARRIGRNELTAMSVCRTYVTAQRQYASAGRDGHPAGVYAQKVHSTSGKHDGLYWADEAADAPPSPLSKFAAQVRSEGYSTEAPAQPRPYMGYHFRIVTRQGSAAPGGARDYVVNGRMSGGFAMIAWPADYGNSGIMSFIVSADGLIHEADLGSQTATVAASINAYNPDQSWRIVD